MMKMVYKPFCLMFALTISKSASQNLTVTSECIEHGTTVKLTCETTNFASAVIFYLNGDNKGGCTTISCGTSIPGYTTPTQSGTSTEMTISNYNHSRDGGDWTCSYGVSTSIPPYKVELGNCEVTTEGSTEGTSTTTPTTTTTTPTTTPTPLTTPSTSPNTCIFFKETSCALNYFSLALIVLLFIASFFVIGYLIKGKRNRRHQQKSGKEIKRNNHKVQELHKM